MQIDGNQFTKQSVSVIIDNIAGELLGEDGRQQSTETFFKFHCGAFTTQFAKLDDIYCKGRL